MREENMTQNQVENLIKKQVENLINEASRKLNRDVFSKSYSMKLFSIHIVKKTGPML